MAAGATQAELIAELTQALSSVSASNPEWGGAALYYNTGNATKIVDNLVGDSATADSKALAVNYIVDQMAAGQTFGAMIAWAITALDGIDHADPVWGNAAALFDNRIEVSRYYSVDRAGIAADLAILQNILTGVTADVATIAIAKAAIDILTLISVINLSSLDGSNGFRLDGMEEGDASGFSVSRAGDINGDGFDDVIVGAFGAAPNGSGSGASYVVLGKASDFSATLALSNLDSNSGFLLDGVVAGDFSGFPVSSAGDVNGDGFDDVIVGAYGADPNGSYSGSSYVVFGGNFTAAVTSLGTSGADKLKGSAAVDRFVAGDGNDTLIGRGGADVFHGGAGDDTIEIRDLNFQLIDGGAGNDTLDLAGRHLDLNLTSSAHGKISDIEAINMTGHGHNTLTLTALDSLNLSSTSNTLKVDGNRNDNAVGLSSGWTDGGIDDGYHTFTQGAAVLLVGINVATDFA